MKIVGISTLRWRMLNRYYNKITFIVNKQFMPFKILKKNFLKIFTKA